MRLLRRPLLVLGAACTLVVSLSGQTVRVLSVSGEATLQAPGDSAPRSVKKGDTIVIGTKIVTGEGARVILTPLPGVNSIIAPQSEVVIERVSISPSDGGSRSSRHSAVLELKTGAVTTDLKSTDGVELDYGVRTARGLAGARGTTYTVGINAAGIQTIVVADGRISLTLADGRVVDLVPGQVSITRPDGSTQAVTSASELSTGDQALADNWVEATLEALAEAIEQGIDIDPEALEDAVRAAVGLGIDIDPDVQAKLDHARDLLEDRRQARLEAGSDGTNNQDAKSVIAELLQSHDTQLDDYLHALAAYLLTLSEDQRHVFESLPDDVQRLLVTVNDSSYTAYALDTYGEGQTRPVELIRYAGKLSGELRSSFYERPADVQEILAAHPSDTGLRDFALTADGESGYPASYVVEYFQPLTSGQRSAFRALDVSLRELLAEANDPTLTGYALATGRTTEQITYALSLSVPNRAVFVTFPSSLQAILVAQAEDTQLADFAYVTDDQGGNLHSHAQIVFYAGLSGEDRALYEQRPLALQERAATDASFAPILLARDTETQAPLYSDATLDHYLKLDAAHTRADYLERPADVRDLFAELDTPALTAAALNEANFSEPPTDADLRRNLTALLALSPENRVLFETFAGGPGYSQLETAPSPADWSDAGWTRTRNAFEALSPSDRATLLALGAMDGLFDYSASYIEAALADYAATLPQTTRNKLTEAGWGRYFVDYFGQQEVRDFFADFGAFTSSQIATLRELGISPHAFLYSGSLMEGMGALIESPYESPDVRARLSYLASLSANDRTLLAQLGAGDQVLFAMGQGRYDSQENWVYPTYEESIQDALAFARKLQTENPDAFPALRETGLGGHLLSYRFDDTLYVGDSQVPAFERINYLLGLYLDLDAAQRDLARDVGLFASIFISDMRLDPGAIASALNTLGSVSQATRDYLALVRGEAPIFDIIIGDGEFSYFYYSIETIDALLSTLTPEEFATLRELRPGTSLISGYYYDEGEILSAADLKAFLAYVGSLSDAQRFTLNELGITKPGHERKGLFLSDHEGLGRLLQAYAELPNDLRVATRQLSTYDASYRDLQGRSFFFPSDDGSDYQTIYDVTFSSPDDLHVGAVRRLSIYAFTQQGGFSENGIIRPATFTVPAGKDVYLRASTLVELNGVSFSDQVRAITIDAATINLAALDFPEGSVVVLNSKLGGMGTGDRYPNFDGNPLPGRVNFLNNVSYGGTGNVMHDEASFDQHSRGNIAIGSFANPAPRPTYTPPPPPPSITQ